MIYLHLSRKTLAFDLPTKTIKSNIDLSSSFIFNFVSNANSTQIQTSITAKKWSFSLTISSLNVTKSADYCGLDYIYWRNP